MERNNYVVEIFLLNFITKKTTVHSISVEQLFFVNKWFLLVERIILFILNLIHFLLD